MHALALLAPRKPYITSDSNIRAKKFNVARNILPLDSPLAPLAKLTIMFVIKTVEARK